MALSGPFEFDQYHLSLIKADPFRDVLREVRRLYPMREIAARTGVSRYELTQIDMGHRRRIRVDTALKLWKHLPEMLPS